MMFYRKWATLNGLSISSSFDYISLITWLIQSCMVCLIRIFRKWWKIWNNRFPIASGEQVMTNNTSNDINQRTESANTAHCIGVYFLCLCAYGRGELSQCVFAITSHAAFLRFLIKVVIFSLTHYDSNLPRWLRNDRQWELCKRFRYLELSAI